MAHIERRAKAEWNGDLRQGSGLISSGSGVLADTPYDFRTRFEQEPGTNPEELIAAAHAACYSMALAHTLKVNGYQPQRIETQAVCTLAPREEGGFKIARMRLESRARVPGIEARKFEDLARQAEQGCPVSGALRGGPTIELDAALL